MPATDPARDVWNDSLLQNPHQVADKRTRVQKMFAAIAPSYDLNNRLHSLWMDQRWRKRAVKLANLKHTDVVVDVACGTGDLAIHFARALHTAQMEDAIDAAKRQIISVNRRNAAQVIGVDFTFDMLPLARAKAPKAYPWGSPRGQDLDRSLFTAFPKRLHHVLGEARELFCRKIENFIGWINGDALALPLRDSSANVVSIAFGIRNVSDPAAALREFYRVLKPAGRLIILEFSLPTNKLLRSLYNFYFTKILPRTATWISRDKTGAYKYLPQSVSTFISRESMQDMMKAAGFTDVKAFPLTFGICICYRGIKP